MSVVNLRVIVLASEAHRPPNRQRARTESRPLHHVWREYLEGDHLLTCRISRKKDRKTEWSIQSWDDWVDEALEDVLIVLQVISEESDILRRQSVAFVGYCISCTKSKSGAMSPII